MKKLFILPLIFLVACNSDPFDGNTSPPLTEVDLNSSQVLIKNKLKKDSLQIVQVIKSHKNDK